MRAWSTYRVQLHPAFGFRDAAAVAGYLADLGVTHLYCSPYFQAASGSSHGYDVVDPQHVNRELGGAPAHADLVSALRDAGLGQVLDIVPNHMATDPSNPWWWDVLENGPASPYAGFFDIDWQGRDEKSAYRVLVPVLGDHYGRLLDAGEIGVERRGGEFVVRYHDHVVPVSPRTLDEVLAAAARRAGSADLAALADDAEALPPARMTDAAAVSERHDRKLRLAEHLAEVTAADPDLAAAVDAEVEALNADPDRLDALLRRQNYRLAFWRTAREELDYRRFFNIESLVGVAVEDPDVFAATHRLVLDVVRDGTVNGLRIDHVDGLRDPTRYLAHLAEQTDGVYTVVEKILATGERFPPDWPVSGTSGYDFLTRVNNLFVATEAEEAMTDAYTTFTGETSPYEDVVYAAKQQVMADDLAAEVERVTALLADVCARDRRYVDHTRSELREALREVVARFPVYRVYVTAGRPATAAEHQAVNDALTASVAHRPEIDGSLLAFIGELALGEHAGAEDMELCLRLQQLTAPVTAKGVEDTAFYRYHRLISLNEVGGDPGRFGATSASFHTETAAIAAHWPDTMLTLSTHDTKRSGDVRARLNTLAERPERWRRAVERWAEHNDGHRTGAWPDRNTEYLIYQTLVGAWPIDVERVVSFATKATKEAKVHTSWIDPAPEYDDAVAAFVRAILADAGFTAQVEQFLADEQLVARGRRNSLVQTALLLTSPGVADLYQGTELWDLSLVDPDNRRPVDYDVRRRLLAEVDAATPADLGPDEDSGAPKLYVVHRLLAHRRERPDAFATARYEPLDVSGAHADDVVAFTRGTVALVGACRTAISDWRDTEVRLPQGAWTDLLTGAGAVDGRQSVGALLGAFPVAVMTRDGS
jgi:(1->4)-alpha-D-glucan 1-alpha-D-glucosylmutase